VPTSLRSGPYRFFFFSGDREEPPHTHVQRESHQAKFWLEPVRLAWTRGFNAAELREIERVVETNESLLMEVWNDFFLEDE